jgi:hypothetical protein
LANIFSVTTVTSAPLGLYISPFLFGDNLQFNKFIPVLAPSIVIPHACNGVALSS